MLAKLYSAGILGVDAYRVEIEADVALGLPSFNLVGLPDNAVREGYVRVRAALDHSGFRLPPRRVTINLAPADVRKDGAAFDLPIALALLVAQQIVPAQALEGMLVLGELGLDGGVRRVIGSLPVALLVKRRGYRGLIVPADNAAEAAAITGVTVHPMDSLQQAVTALRGEAPLPRVTAADLPDPPPAAKLPDMRDVRGNEGPKRALEIAAAGGHNLLFIGPPGTGKSMLARRLPGILPPLSDEEATETSAIYSAAGLLNGAALMRARPFRAPHLDVSVPGLVGGGPVPRPGELSLAHNGVLFLDELPEFHRAALEAMRAPMEDGFINIVRTRATMRYPCRFALVAAMNPCPCGYAGSTRRACTCDIGRFNRYRARLSGPLLDRFDLHAEVPHVDYMDLMDPNRAGEPSEVVRERVVRARARQDERRATPGFPRCNAELSPAQLEQCARLEQRANNFLARYVYRYTLSSRGINRVMRVARTIADLADSETVEKNHVAEALILRVLDREGQEDDDGY